VTKIIHAFSFGSLTLGLLLTMNVSAYGGSLRVAVSKVDITPPPGLAMWGYAGRQQPAVDTRDPLYARVLVLEAGQKRVALVVLDLGRSFGRKWIEVLRARVAKSSGIAYVLCHATHTHAGPMIADDYPPGKIPPWESDALEKIASAISAASRDLVDGRIGVAYGVAYIAHNRIKTGPDGKIKMFWRNETRIATAPIDPTVAVVRIDSSDGKPLAILVNHACHAVILAPDNLKYSADFPGFMCRTVEAAFGNSILCFFLQGGAGDIDPYYALTRLAMDPDARIEWTGNQLGEAAIRVARGISSEEAPDSSLDFVEDWMTFARRWGPENLPILTNGAQAEATNRVTDPIIESQLTYPVLTMLINKRLALIAMPGEPFVDLQMNWRDRNPARDTLFLGYSNAYCGYIPTIAAAARGGYGAASEGAQLEVGAGERMVDRSIVHLYVMLRKLTREPETLWK
jgi:neutral ceramidase